MNQITVIIPPQVYDRDKYTGSRGQMCYLHEALHNAGYEHIRVSSCGSTDIGKDHFETMERFDCETVKEAFIEKQSIIVTLIRQNS